MPEYRVEVSQLRVGVFIRLELKWTQHPFFFKSFKIKDQEQIDILKDLGLSTVLCIPEKSDCLPHPLPKDLENAGQARCPQPDEAGFEKKSSSSSLWNIKQRQIEQLKRQRERFESCQDKFKQTISRVNRVMTNLGTASAEVVAEASSIVQGLVASLMSDKDNMVHLMNAKAGKQDVFYHSLNTCVLAMIIAKEYGLKAEAIQELGLGMLFHDVGKLRIPKKVLLKQASLLTHAETDLIKLHPVFGQEILDKAGNFPQASLAVVRHHHETIDGKGYPDGLCDEQIPVAVKIAYIVNVYDNHCNKFDPKTSLTPAQAISYMFARQKGRFDPQLLSLFIRCLGIYPPGSVVQLSNECTGMVVSVNSRNSLRPGVLIYDPEVPKHEALVFDLETDPELAIVKSIHPGQLTPEIFDYLSPRTRVTYFIDQSEGESRAGSR